MKRILALTLSMVMLAALAACGSSSAVPPAASEGTNTADANNGAASNEPAPAAAGAESEAVTIRLLTRMTGTSPQAQIYNQVIDEFKSNHPEVTIVDDSQGDESAFNNILKTDMASGTVANIYRIQGVANLAQYIDEGYLLNVEPFMKDDPEWGNGFVEGALNYYRVPGYDGIYGIPCEGGLVGIYYNEKILKEAGIEKFPEKWSEFIEAGKKLKAHGVMPLALGAKATYMAGHLHDQIFYKWMGADAAKSLGNRSMAYTDPEVVKTFEFVQQLYKEGIIPEETAGYSDDVVMTEFLMGNAAMIITGPWSVARFRNLDDSVISDDVRLAKFPYFDEKPEFKDEDMQVISPYMISGKISGKELELTMELAKMLTSKETATRFAVEAAQYIPRSDIELEGAELDPLFIKTIELCSTSTGVAVDVFDYDPIASMQDRTRNSIVSLFTGATPEEAAKEIQNAVDNGG